MLFKIRIKVKFLIKDLEEFKRLIEQKKTLLK
jgi:HJR/Mrr/RecB family endonuclease